MDKKLVVSLIAAAFVAGIVLTWIFSLLAEEYLDLKYLALKANCLLQRHSQPMHKCPGRLIQPQYHSRPIHRRPGRLVQQM